MGRQRNIVAANSARMFLTSAFHLLVLTKLIFVRDKKFIVNEATTLRRHLEARHSVSL